jgi:ubiquinone/menaquinone biosynthesis C-methylase UbiE
MPGFYRDQIVPRLTHLAMSTKELAGHRRAALEDVSGEVLELGIGSGANLPHYGARVRRVVGVDPSRVAARLARKRIQEADFPVEILPSEAESLAVDGARFDAVVFTFALCTIPDVAQALATARRALRPGGRLFFLEHGLSNERHIQRWQRRLEPMQKRIGGGCHLTRDPRALIEQAGFAIGQLETYYAKGPKPWSFLYRGSGSIGSAPTGS